MKAKFGFWLKALAGTAVLVGAGILIAQHTSGGADTVPESAKRAPTMVLFTEAREIDFDESVNSDGSIKARYYALVSPKINGPIDDIFVREGNVVAAGKTKLFQIDNEKLQQAVDLDTQALTIAKSSLEERKANLDHADAELAQAEKDFARTEQLFNQKVVTLSEYEQDQTKVRQRDALCRLARTQVVLAEQTVTKTEISLEMSKRDLRDSVVLAPIDGIVSGRYAEPGEMGSTGKSILRIDDVKDLKAVAYLPGQFYPRITPGESVAFVSVLGKELGAFPVTYKAPAIDSALRTFEVWADLPGDGAYSVPGAQAAIRVVLREGRGVGVPRDAIQYRDGKFWIFIPDGDTAKMIEVKQGMETDGWIELVDSPIQAGDKVVTQGQFLLNDGYPIRERTAIGGDR